MLNVIDIHTAPRRRAVHRPGTTLCMRCGKLPAAARTTRQYVWMPRAGRLFFLFGIFGLIGVYLAAPRQVYTIYTCHGCDQRDDGRGGALTALILLIGLQVAALVSLLMGAPPMVNVLLGLAIIAAGLRAAAAPRDVHVKRMSGGHVILSLEPESRIWLPDGVAESFPIFFPHLADRNIPLTLCHGCGHTNEALHGVCSRCQRVLDVRATVWRPAAA